MLQWRFPDFLIFYFIGKVPSVWKDGNSLRKGQVSKMDVLTFYTPIPLISEQWFLKHLFKCYQWEDLVNICWTIIVELSLIFDTFNNWFFDSGSLLWIILFSVIYAMISRINNWFYLLNVFCKELKIIHFLLQFITQVKNRSLLLQVKPDE